MLPNGCASKPLGCVIWIVLFVIATNFGSIGGVLGLLAGWLIAFPAAKWLMVKAGVEISDAEDFLNTEAEIERLKEENAELEAKTQREIQKRVEELRDLERQKQEKRKKH